MLIVGFASARMVSAKLQGILSQTAANHFLGLQVLISWEECTYVHCASGGREGGGMFMRVGFVFFQIKAYLTYFFNLEMACARTPNSRLCT
jgi:hypothetical protein